MSIFLSCCWCRQFITECVFIEDNISSRSRSFFFFVVQKLNVRFSAHIKKWINRHEDGSEKKAERRLMERSIFRLEVRDSINEVYFSCAFKEETVFMSIFLLNFAMFKISN